MSKRFKANISRLIAARDRIIAAMGWKEGITGEESAVVRAVTSGRAMAVSAKQLEQIAERLEQGTKGATDVQEA